MNGPYIDTSNFLGNFSLQNQFIWPPCRIWSLHVKVFLKIEISPGLMQLFSWVFVLLPSSGMSFQRLMTHVIISGWCFFSFFFLQLAASYQWTLDCTAGVARIKSTWQMAAIFLSSFKSFLWVKSYFYDHMVYHEVLWSLVLSSLFWVHFWKKPCNSHFLSKNWLWRLKCT